ncbi:methionine sulfoxide reductase [Pelomyxa schiedti]|nr:methionine sulfoxide reductase [Pelomyxa schiedti]
MATSHNSLTEAERSVLVGRGTERPHSGRFCDHFERGTYSCRRCGNPLYLYSSKFDSECGWPAFDAEVSKGAVSRRPDGSRTEITCGKCGGHLGHVFEGEQFTATNTRHCVNSLSLKFTHQPSEVLQRALFAGGCFWGVEYYLAKMPGVVSTTCGFTGGRLPNPTYEQVCEGDTGHAETVLVVFDPSRVTYEALCRTFFEIHDPSQLNRQGPDVGDQYRSEVFCFDSGQVAVVESLIKELRSKGQKVQTRATHPAPEFFPAEDYHQEYYFRRGEAPHCHRRTRRF